MGLVVDRATFGRLVSDHLPAAVAFATRLTGDPEAAEEVVAEALFRAARSWRTFHGRSTFRTWLFGVVINAFRDHAKARTTEASLNEESRDERAVDPRDQAMADELGQLIARLVSSLPPRQREVLVLVTYEGFSPAEVAEALSINQANVHATLHHARRRLKQQLAPYFAGK